MKSGVYSFLVAAPLSPHQLENRSRAPARAEEWFRITRPGKGGQSLPPLAISAAVRGVAKKGATAAMAPHEVQKFFLFQKYYYFVKMDQF